jgi:hypothetical protein
MVQRYVVISGYYVEDGYITHCDSVPSVLVEEHPDGTVSLPVGIPDGEFSHGLTAFGANIYTNIITREAENRAEHAAVFGMCAPTTIDPPHGLKWAGLGSLGNLDHGSAVALFRIIRQTYLWLIVNDRDEVLTCNGDFPLLRYPPHMGSYVLTPFRSFGGWICWSKDSVQRHNQYDFDSLLQEEHAWVPLAEFKAGWPESMRAKGVVFESLIRHVFETHEFPRLKTSVSVYELI